MSEENGNKDRRGLMGSKNSVSPIIVFPTCFSPRILSSNKISEEAQYTEPNGKGLKNPLGLSLENAGLYSSCVGWSGEVFSYFAV